MNFAMPFFAAAIPDIFLLMMISTILLVDVFLNDKHRIITYFLVQTTLVATFFLTMRQYLQHTNPIITFSSNYIVDELALVIKLFTCGVCFFAFAYARDYLKNRQIAFGEYFILGLFAVLGMFVMASAYSFLTIFIGLELLSLPLYAMVAMPKNSSIAIEAAMKYFVMGAFASAFILYGMSLVYGATGSILISDIALNLLNVTDAKTTVVVLGLVFMLVGLTFKFGAVPFHMWVPDVYEGAPTSMTLFIASAPKIAALGITMRILVEALPSVHVQWVSALTVISLLSMFIGNLLAIAQTNIKRMLAYSSIAHIGYMLLGIVAGPTSADGYPAAMFYIVTYVIVAVGGFAIIGMLSKEGQEFDQLVDFRGLNARNSWLAFMMLLFMFSMAGIPPTVGFFGKLGLLQGLVQAHMEWLASLALLSAIIGAYYYLRVVMLMFFEEPLPQNKAKIIIPIDMTILVTITGVASLALGLFPSTLIDICRVSLG